MQQVLKFITYAEEEEKWEKRDRVELGGTYMKSSHKVTESNKNPKRKLTGEAAMMIWVVKGEFSMGEEKDGEDSAA